MHEEYVSGDYIKMALRQLGPSEVVKLNSVLNIVTFDITDKVKVSYVFNITKENKFYVQRMKPYALSQGKFSTADQIIDFIQKDLAQFRNASKSHNFENFLKINAYGNQMVANMEELFLNNNVDQDTINHIHYFMYELNDIIKESMKNSPKIK